MTTYKSCIMIFAPLTYYHFLLPVTLSIEENLRAFALRILLVGFSSISSEACQYSTNSCYDFIQQSPKFSMIRKGWNSRLWFEYRATSMNVQGSSKWREEHNAVQTIQGVRLWGNFRWSLINIAKKAERNCSKSAYSAFAVYQLL